VTETADKPLGRSDSTALATSRPLSLLLSAGVHALLAGVLLAVPSSDGQAPMAMIELTDRQLPPPPAPPEPPKPPPEPEEPPPEEPPPEPVKKPEVVKKPVRRERIPRPTPAEPPPPQPEGQPDAEEPAADDTGARTFGLEMEGTTAAPTGSGVAVPRGDTLETDPGAKRIGKGKPEGKRRGFKKTYERGERAPLSVVTAMPRLLRNVEVEYPSELEELGVEGQVVLRLRVDETGKVAEAKLLRGLHPLADRIALKKARELRFTPAKVNQTAVSIEIEYRFNFVLD
jgi:TonB family protein